jgi:hypothetical protein
MSGRARLLFVRIGSLVVLLLAVLPNVLYVGHGGLLGGQTDILSETEAAEHASHCHLGPKQCSFGFGSAEALPPAEEVVVAAGGLLALLWAPAVVKVSGLPTRLERPPRGTILFATP